MRLISWTYPRGSKQAEPTKRYIKKPRQAFVLSWLDPWGMSTAATFRLQKKILDQPPSQKTLLWIHRGEEVGCVYYNYIFLHIYIHNKKYIFKNIYMYREREGAAETWSLDCSFKETSKPNMKSWNLLALIPLHIWYGHRWASLTQNLTS